MEMDWILKKLTKFFEVLKLCLEKVANDLLSLLRFIYFIFSK